MNGESTPKRVTRRSWIGRQEHFDQLARRYKPRPVLSAFVTENVMQRVQPIRGCPFEYPTVAQTQLLEQPKYMPGAFHIVKDAWTRHDALENNMNGGQPRGLLIVIAALFATFGSDKHQLELGPRVLVKLALADHDGRHEEEVKWAERRQTRRRLKHTLGVCLQHRLGPICGDVIRKDPWIRALIVASAADIWPQGMIHHLRDDLGGGEPARRKEGNGVMLQRTRKDLKRGMEHIRRRASREKVTYKRSTEGVILCRSECQVNITIGGSRYIGKFLKQAADNIPVDLCRVTKESLELGYDLLGRRSVGRFFMAKS
mmetsp:Transcript_33706/g.52470  ORF Transcript_33706/g.52470 Transcript_33706/m.52470 type:complete len:315 (+) Transcript_33706:1085-2029(+)